MPIPANPVLFDSDGNLIVPRYGIRIVLGLALLAYAAFWMISFLEDKQWHVHHPGTGASGVPDPLWMVILWGALSLVPFILSQLLLTTRCEESVAAGAGVAAALCVSSLMFSLAMAAGFVFWGPEYYAIPTAITVLTLIGCSVWVIVSAFRIGAKAGWIVFFLAGGATLFCMTWAFLSLKSAEDELDRQNEQRKVQAALEVFEPLENVQHRLTLLASCLILNESIHPQSAYPSSLDPPPANWPCEGKFVANAVKEYSLNYIPQVDPATGRVTDFHLIAVPVRKGVPGRYALMVDRRGIVFSNPMWGISNAYVKAAKSEVRFSEIEELRANIEHYMKVNDLAAAPLTLHAKAIGTTYGFQVPSIEDNGTRLEIKNYVLYYLAPQARNLSRFALSVQCQSYGQDCLRSYFLDYDGVLHATGEPRQATSDDPPALECEASDSPCKDVIWPRAGSG
jgi:hypothetical protein